MRSATGPEADLWRWWAMMVRVSYQAAVIRNVSPQTEEDLRDMWHAVRWRKVP